MILYFSATGNSKYVATRVAEETNERLVSIADCNKKDFLSWAVISSSYLGPPLEAAVIWAATPIFITSVFSVPAPRVAFLQFGLLHFHPTLFANKSFVACEKSSLIYFPR